MLARSPDRKRATEYLAACGAASITLTERDGVCSIITAKTASGRIIARWWLHAAQDAASVAAQARRFAGARPDVSAAIEAVKRSAGILRATLTPDDIAIARAANSMQRLDSLIATMRVDGTLALFNQRYKRGRAAAKAEGRGFMGYNTALARLKLALIPALTAGKPIAGIFAEVFR
jgi:hypothetical protein